MKLELSYHSNEQSDKEFLSHLLCFGSLGCSLFLCSGGHYSKLKLTVTGSGWKCGSGSASVQVHMHEMERCD